MIEQQEVTVPRWFWAIAAVSLLWNILGCIMFLLEMFAQEVMIESMTQEQKEWARSTPSWIYLVFAISVCAGVAGSSCLLLRKRLTVSLFAISFVSVLIQMVFTMLIAGGLQVMGPAGMVMPALVTLLSLSWLLFAWFSQGKGWLAAYARPSA